MEGIASGEGESGRGVLLPRDITVRAFTRQGSGKGRRSGREERVMETGRK